MVSRSLLALASVAVIASIAGTADARPFRVDEIPNGTKFDCRNCHNDDEGATNTPFLADVRSSLIGMPIQEAHVTWGPALCNVDSDGDGWSNAIELGDPDCVWTPGAQPAKPPSGNPGDPKKHPSPVCKNGKLDAGEACDAGQQSTTDCADVSAGQGELGCNEADCTYDYSECSQPPGGRAIEDGGLSEEEGCTVVAPLGRDGGDAGGSIFFVALAGAFVISRFCARGDGARPRERRPGA